MARLETSDDIITVFDSDPNGDGIDTLMNIERLQFNDGTITCWWRARMLDPLGQPTVSDGNAAAIWASS